VGDTARRGGRVALGIAVIVAGVLWTLLWGVVALMAWTFGGDTSGWVIGSAALALGVLVCVLGISLVRGRQPRRPEWLVVGGVMLALFVLPVGSWLDDREADPVNSAVQRTLMDRSRGGEVKADCGRLEDNRDGSESWVCDVQIGFDYDVCFADVTRMGGLVSARVHDCLSDGFEP
jgi:hypothetical protein